MARFTRLRPSRIPARKNSVRRCCFTVRGRMLSCPAISIVAATLHQQVQHLLVAGRHFHLLHIDRFFFSCFLENHTRPLNSTAFANSSSPQYSSG